MELQERFEKHILPAVDACATRMFGGKFPGNDEKIEELTQEARGLAWKSFVSIVAKGRRPEDFPTVLARRACQSALNGRKTARVEKPTSISNPQTQAKKGIEQKPLGREAEHARHCDTISSPSEQAAFGIDYTEWLSQQGANKPIIEDMAGGERTKTMAARYGKSQGRISQMRREAHDDWRYRYQHEEKPDRER